MKTFKLPKEATEKWLKNLRSGEYSQTSDSLVEVTNKGRVLAPCGYCCLGVALVGVGVNPLDIAGYGEPHSLIENDVIEDYPKDYPFKEANIREEELERMLMTLNDGFTSTNYKNWIARFPSLIFSELPGQSENNSLISYSFDQIAEFIETNVELIEE